MDGALGPLSKKEMRKLRKARSSASAAAISPASTLSDAQKLETPLTQARTPDESNNPAGDRGSNRNTRAESRSSPLDGPTATPTKKSPPAPPSAPAPVSTQSSELPEAAPTSQSNVTEVGATQVHASLPPFALPAPTVPTSLQFQPTLSTATAQSSVQRRRTSPKKKWAPVDLGELAPDARPRLDRPLSPKKRQPTNQPQPPANQAAYFNAAVAPAGADAMAWATQRLAASSLQAEDTSSPPPANPVRYTQLGSMKIYHPGYEPGPATPAAVLPAAALPAPATPSPAARAPPSAGQRRRQSDDSPPRPAPARRRKIPGHKRLTAADIVPRKFVNIQPLSSDELAALPDGHNEGWRGHPGEILGEWDGDVALLGTTSFKGLGMDAKFAVANRENQAELKKSFMLIRGRDDAVPEDEDAEKVLRLEGQMAFYANTRIDTRAVRWIPRERFHVDCSNFFVKDTTVPVFLSRESFDRQEKRLLELAGQELAWKKEDQEGLRRYAEYRAIERSLQEM